MTKYDSYPTWAQLAISEWEYELADGIIGFSQFNELMEELEEQLKTNGYTEPQDAT